nr:MAG TPA: hypothetical protein [Caudoviricetes sp.]
MTTVLFCLFYDYRFILFQNSFYGMFRNSRFR